MSPGLPRVCRAYVVCVVAAGVVPLGWALWSLASRPPGVSWIFIAALSLLGGPLSIRIPSLGATISVSEGFIFAATLLFGPAAGTIAGVLDGLVVSLWSRQRTLPRLLFNVAEPAISVCAASLLFYELSGVQPLLHHPVPLVPLLGPLVALTAAYFGLNTLLTGAALLLETGVSPAAFLRSHVPHLALDFSVTLSLAAMIVLTSGNLTLAALVVLAPMLFTSYLSSRHVAGRLEDATAHIAELKRLHDSAIETLAMAIDAKDQITHGHIRRVQTLSVNLARELKASPDEVKALEAAALLHDLGKLAVPEHILNKPGALTAAEYEQMKAHAGVGAEILSAIEFPFAVAPIVRHHHENWDGTGYPDGLSGEAIPLGARILSVADCYDALTSDRPYRRRMSEEDAVEIIRGRAGRMYDPAVVECFLTVYKTIPATSTKMEGDLLAPLQLARATGQAPPAAQAARRSPENSGRRAALRQFVASLSGSEWDEICAAVSRFVTATVRDTVVALYRYDETADQLEAGSLDDRARGLVPPVVRLGQGVTGWVGANRQTMANTDAHLELGEAASRALPPLRMCVSAPLTPPSNGAQLSGVLTVFSPYAFSEAERTLLELLAEALGPVVHATARREPSLPERTHDRASSPLRVN